MARLGRAQPHRPILPAQFVTAPTTPIAKQPLIRSRAVQAANPVKRPSRIVGQHFVTPPPPAGPVVSFPLIRSRAVSAARSAYLLSSQTQRSVFPPPPPPPEPPEPPFPSEGDRGLMLRVGAQGGAPVHALIDGFCDDLAPGDRAVGLVVGVDENGRQILAWSKQKCEDGTTNLEIGQRYIGLVVGVDENGRQILASFCKPCEEGEPTICGCVVCDTLSATVQVGDGTTGGAWSDPVDVELARGGIYQKHYGYYCGNEEDFEDVVPVKVTTTFAEKDNLGSPEPYIIVLPPSSGTRETKTQIWSSGDFDIDGETYRLTYTRSETNTYQVLPSVATFPTCYIFWELQKWVTDAEFGDYLVTISTNVFTPLVTAIGAEWLFTVTDDDSGCAEGYGYVGDGPQSYIVSCCPGSFPTYTGGGYEEQDDCPVAVAFEAYCRLTSDPDDDAHRIKCVRVSIADLCDEEE